MVPNSHRKADSVHFSIFLTLRLRAQKAQAGIEAEETAVQYCPQKVVSLLRVSPEEEQVASPPAPQKEICNSWVFLRTLSHQCCPLSGRYILHLTILYTLVLSF